jgi:tetratricopeptide (TPR) repeat protein
LCEAQIASKDTAAALQTLKTGRAAFPNDISLMNKETEFYLIQGKQQEAIDNLNKAIAQSPKQAILYMVRGNVYDNLANPTGAEKQKPTNYEELVIKAEADYLKTIELDPGNFNSWYNIGALYNNWGVFYQTKADAFNKVNAEQKALAEKAQTMFKKAITNLEKALEINSTESQTMFALRKLYLQTGDSAKATLMSERMKK